MIKLILFDIDPLRCSWLGHALERAGFFVVATVSGRDQLLSHIIIHKPQIVLIAPLLTTNEGAALTRQIMEKAPVPVVLLTPENETPSENLCNWCGATAVLRVPAAPNDRNHAVQLAELTSTLTLMHEVPVVKRKTGDDITEPAKTGHEHVEAAPLKKTSLSGPTTTLQPPKPLVDKILPNIIGIASSTGGPGIVQKILSKLPGNYPIPIVVVQHLSDGFSDALNHWLDEQTALKVQEAQDGQHCRPGNVYIASGSHHITVTSGLIIKLIKHEVFPGHCPSATVMFDSIAKTSGSRSVGIILTGMGSDGSEGLYQIKTRGGLTFAQDENSCAVASMPLRAIERGAVTSVLTPDGIAAALLKIVKKS